MTGRSRPDNRSAAPTAPVLLPRRGLGLVCARRPSRSRRRLTSRGARRSADRVGRTTDNEVATDENHPQGSAGGSGRGARPGRDVLRRVRARASGDEGGGGGTFTFGAAGAPEMFDPLYATDGETFRVTRQMFEGLLGIEPGSAEVAPELATEWTSNEDGTEWTFTLRDDVTFHDGDPVQRRGGLRQLRADVRPERGRPGRRPSTGATSWAGSPNDPEDSLYESCEATGTSRRRSRSPARPPASRRC